MFKRKKFILGCYSFVSLNLTFGNSSYFRTVKSRPPHRKLEPRRWTLSRARTFRWRHHSCDSSRTGNAPGNPKSVSFRSNSFQHFQTKTASAEIIVVIIIFFFHYKDVFTDATLLSFSISLRFWLKIQKNLRFFDAKSCMVLNDCFTSATLRNLFLPPIEQHVVDTNAGK